MKTLPGRLVFWGGNLAGLLLLFLIIGGMRIFGQTSLGWFTLFTIAGLSACLIILINFLVFSYSVLSPLKKVSRLAEQLEPHDVPAAPTIRVRELQKLALALHEHTSDLHELIQVSHQFLKNGEHQQISARSEQARLGSIIRQFMTTSEMLTRYVRELSVGHLYLEIPETLRGTELGQSLQMMTTALRLIITDLRKETTRISMASAKIAAMSQQGSRNATTETQAIEIISSSIHEVAGNLREVMQNIRRQADSLEKTFTDIQDMLTSTEHINSSVELLSASTEATSRSINEIHEFMQEIDNHAHSLANISETISNEATEGGQAVEKVIEGIQTIKQAVEEAAIEIRQLGDESGHIGEIVEVINGVAEQTNLLALNASIIAAQAGEHGRGFSVVADEIKGLAERTRASTQAIGEIIRFLQTGVDQGTIAMKRCLDAVGDGVSLANQSGEVLGKIVLSIQGAKEMAVSLAEATVAQTRNSQQVHQATEQITQKIEELYSTASKQTKDTTHLVEMANILKDVTQHIDQSAATQSQAAESIVRSIEEIQSLVQRNATIAHELATSSEELGALESNLADNMGTFLITPPPLPADFDHHTPTVAFLYPGAPFFYNYIQQGIQSIFSAKHIQTLALNSENDPILQAEYCNWLMRQPWLEGIVLVSFDEQTGGRIVLNAQKKGIPLVVVDRAAQHAKVVVVSDNEQGGQYAAEMLRETLTGNHTVLACGPRNISSIFNRMEGFFKKARSYYWQVAEVFTLAMNIEEAKQSILEGLRMNPDAQGVFLTNEHASFAYLDLLTEGKLAGRDLYAISYDINAEIAKAIRQGNLLGTVFQDPEKLGKVAAQELSEVLQRQKLPTTPKETLVPVKKITRKNLESAWAFSAKENT